MVIDIDFIPSEGFWEYLVAEDMFDRLTHSAINHRRVWALVSLELHETYLALPRDKRAVETCLQNASVVVAEAYLNPAAHAPVQVPDWLNTSEVRPPQPPPAPQLCDRPRQETGPLAAGEGFEPFILGARAVLPLYDERFRGYGWDKTTHALHLVALGCRYHLLPHHFVVARYHQPTPTAVRIFGEPPDTLLRLRMEWLFARFSAELAELGPRHPRLPRVAAHAVAGGA